MAKYIDADALMKEFAEFVRPSNMSDFEPIPTWNDAVSLLGSAPAADVVETDAIKNMVEVVMCRDCKRYTENCFCEFWQRTGAVIQLSIYDFCSYGERLEE